MFTKRDRVNSRIELSQCQGKYYLNCGLRRVYTTGWAEQWRRWEQDHGAIGRNGEALTCYRPRVDSKQRRYYYDMSMVDIDIHRLEQIQPFDPVDTKYMNSRYLGSVTLRDCAHLPTSDFLRLISTLGHRHRDGREKHHTRS